LACGDQSLTSLVGAFSDAMKRLPSSGPWRRARSRTADDAGGTLRPEGLGSPGLVSPTNPLAFVEPDIIQVLPYVLRINVQYGI
jgi:hypothetical protein